MQNLNENQIVRLYAYPPSSKNAKAKVMKVYDNGNIWINNISMKGNLNLILSKSDFKKLTEI